jgi:hypothetical protein
MAKAAAPASDPGPEIKPPCDPRMELRCSGWRPPLIPDYIRETTTFVGPKKLRRPERFIEPPDRGDGPPDEAKGKRANRAGTSGRVGK